MLCKLTKRKSKTKSCYLYGSQVKCFGKISGKIISAKLSDKATEC